MLKAGTKIKVIETECGAYGCIGKIGEVIFMDGVDDGREYPVYLKTKGKKGNDEYWAIGEETKIKYEILS